MQINARSLHNLSLVFGFFVFLQILLSLGVRPERAQWGNVPDAPNMVAYQSSFLGDSSLAHRMVGMLLQNFGGSGGRVESIHEYDMHKVAQWLALGFELEERSNYLPFLAAYYFGATETKSELEPLIDFLAEVGRYDDDDNWRWLSNAVYLARFRAENFEKAVVLADELATMYKPGRPALIAQMPAFIQLQIGDKDAAYAIMLELIKESSETMHPNEVNFMVDYICTRTLSPKKALENPLCQ